jgi:hypothetical protein
MSDNMAMASPPSAESAALYQTTKELISQHAFEVRAIDISYVKNNP